MHRKTYSKLALGGTFDHFHLGHQHFIDFCAALADTIIIGITVQQLTHSKPHATTIESFLTRKSAILHYCKKKHYHCQIVELTDLYGPTLEDPTIKALSVTEATVQGAKLINQMRQKLNQRPLPVHVCDLIDDSAGQPISSSRIRSGEISRQGEVYAAAFVTPLILTETQRAFFQEPQGQIITQPTKSNHLKIVVGDSSTAQFIEHNWPYQVAIFDGKEQRQPSNQVVLRPSSAPVNNPAGNITPKLVTTILKALHHPPQTIFVNGEEDLAAVVSILLAPLGSFVYYGQPHQGLVEVEVTEEMKEHFFSALTA